MWCEDATLQSTAEGDSTVTDLVLVLVCGEMGSIISVQGISGLGFFVRGGGLAFRLHFNHKDSCLYQVYDRKA